jgi:hypothetical protein
MIPVKMIACNLYIISKTSMNFKGIEVHVLIFKERIENKEILNY